MTYPGGKEGSGVYQQIINKIPPHDVYVEPFLGGGAVLRMKRPAARSIAIDIDQKVIERFGNWHIPDLTITRADALQWLRSQYFTKRTFLYLDPPYLMHSRSSQRQMYKYEFTESAHIELLAIIQRTPAMVMISGYDNALYSDMLGSWWTTTFQTTDRRGNVKNEKLWMNYPPPGCLHDYSYLGTNFRERERIKKKKNRWTRRLLSMPDHERHALVAAMTEIEDTR